MDPLVSVIVPVYKVESYLNLCMESLLNQTYANLEIILVDDGSPDQCPILCETYAQQDNRIKVIHKENGGLSDARNAGIRIASGEYITFVDSDDILAINAIAEMVTLAKKEQSDIVKITLQRRTSVQHCIPTSGKYIVISGKAALERIYTDKPQIISACGKLFRRELFRDTLFPIGIYHEDEFTTPKLYHQAKRVVLSESILYFYMQWENNSIMRATLNEKRIKDSLFVSNERIDFFRKINEPVLIRKAIADHYIKLQKFKKESSSLAELTQIQKYLIKEKRAFGWSHPFISTFVCGKQFLSRLKHKFLTQCIKKH